MMLGGEGGNEGGVSVCVRKRAAPLTQNVFNILNFISGQHFNFNLNSRGGRQVKPSNLLITCFAKIPRRIHGTAWRCQWWWRLPLLLLLLPVPCLCNFQNCRYQTRRTLARLVVCAAPVSVISFSPRALHNANVRRLTCYVRGEIVYIRCYFCFLTVKMCIQCFALPDCDALCNIGTRYKVHAYVSVGIFCFNISNLVLYLYDQFKTF